jgi:maleamate amidohydrolase
MQVSALTPREWWAHIKTQPGRAKFGFGQKAALVHVDLQRAYTDRSFATAYETDPRQIEFCNVLSQLTRSRGWPVVFSYVAYAPDAADAGVWGTRSQTVDSLQNIKHGSDRAQFDTRVDVNRERDTVLCKRMPSVFFETHLRSLLTWHRVDTVILTGGSTSGCVRASAVDSLSCGFRTIVVEECVADKHEIPHFANLCDLMLKYADVESFSSVQDYLLGGSQAGLP